MLTCIMLAVIECYIYAYPHLLIGMFQSSSNQAKGHAFASKTADTFWMGVSPILQQKSCFPLECCDVNLGCHTKHIRKHAYTFVSLFALLNPIAIDIYFS